MTKIDLKRSQPESAADTNIGFRIGQDMMRLALNLSELEDIIESVTRQSVEEQGGRKDLTRKALLRVFARIVQKGMHRLFDINNRVLRPVECKLKERHDHEYHPRAVTTVVLTWAAAYLNGVDASWLSTFFAGARDEMAEIIVEQGVGH